MADMDPTPADTVAKQRWLVITLTRIAGTAGAVLGLVLIGRSDELGPKILGVAIVLPALLMIAIGIRSMLSLPIDAVPDVTPNQVQVLTNSPGLGPVCAITLKELVRLD